MFYLVTNQSVRPRSDHPLHAQPGPTWQVDEREMHESPHAFPSRQTRQQLPLPGGPATVLSEQPVSGAPLKTTAIAARRSAASARRATGRYCITARMHTPAVDDTSTCAQCSCSRRAYLSSRRGSSVAS